MEKREIKNAVIEEASICLERGVLLCFSLRFDYGGSGQSTSICFGTADKEKIIQPNHMAHFVGRILNLVEVESVEELKGKSVRVDASFSSIYRIGHYLEDKWYDLEQIAEGEA
jgi:hypothetical protein